MKKLYLKLRTEGLHDLGFDIVWDNVGFDFVAHKDLGVFDTLNIALQDDIQGRLVFSGMNTGERHVFGEHEIAELEFAWAAGADNSVVQFAVDNVTAKNKDGEEVDIKIYPADYSPDPNTIIEFIWR